MKDQCRNKGTAELSLTSQLEDYLETIAELQRTNQAARAKEIAERLQITQATVTSALKSLRKKGLINYQPYSSVTLTDSGEELAAKIIQRHRTVSRYLHEVLQLPLEVAEENACRAEHVLDPQVIERLICHMEFLERCPRMITLWQESVNHACGERDEINQKQCRDCIGRCLATVFHKKLS